jgi:hypothetical protein
VDQPEFLRNHQQVTNPSADRCATIHSWLALYPASDQEDATLQRCAVASELTPELVGAALTSSPVFVPPARRNHQLAAIDEEHWPQTHQRLLESLGNDDDAIALINLTMDGGAEGLGVSTASILLAAFRPDRFAPFLVPSRRALVRLGLFEEQPYKGQLSSEWRPFLETCRGLSTDCDLSLRDIGRALIVGGHKPSGTVPRASS